MSQLPIFLTCLSVSHRNIIWLNAFRVGGCDEPEIAVQNTNEIVENPWDGERNRRPPADTGVGLHLALDVAPEFGQQSLESRHERLSNGNDVRGEAPVETLNVVAKRDTDTFRPAADFFQRGWSI